MMDCAEYMRAVEPHGLSDQLSPSALVHTILVTAAVSGLFVLGKTTYDNYRLARIKATGLVIGAGPAGLVAAILLARAGKSSRIIIYESCSREELMRKREYLCLTGKSIQFLRSLGVVDVNGWTASSSSTSQLFNQIPAKQSMNQRQLSTTSGELTRCLLAVLECWQGPEIIDIRYGTKFTRESLKELDTISERLLAVVCDGSRGRAACLLGLSDEYSQHSCRAYGASATFSENLPTLPPASQISVSEESMVAEKDIRDVYECGSVEGLNTAWNNLGDRLEYISSGADSSQSAREVGGTCLFTSPNVITEGSESGQSSEPVIKPSCYYHSDFESNKRRRSSVLQDIQENSVEDKTEDCSESDRSEGKEEMSHTPEKEITSDTCMKEISHTSDKVFTSDTCERCESKDAPDPNKEITRTSDTTREKEKCGESSEKKEVQCLTNDCSMNDTVATKHLQSATALNYIYSINNGSAKGSKLKDFQLLNDSGTAQAQNKRFQPEIVIRYLKINLNALQGREYSEDPFPVSFNFRIFGLRSERHMSLAVPRCESRLVRSLKVNLDPSVMRSIFQACYNSYKSPLEAPLTDATAQKSFKFSPRMFEIKIYERLESVAYIEDANIIVLTEGSAARFTNFNSGTDLNLELSGLQSVEEFARRVSCTTDERQIRLALESKYRHSLAISRDFLKKGFRDLILS